MAAPPVVDLDMQAFWQDPYPALAELRKSTPIAYVPQLGGVVITRRDDIAVCEKNIAVFSSHQPDGLMNKLMGHNMMRKDGDAHLAERATIFPTVSPKTVKNHWRNIFEEDARRILTDLKPAGQCELCNDYALPLSGDALRAITGLVNLDFRQMDACSQAMIDGISNYAGDRKVEVKCHEATALLDNAISEMVPVLARSPNASLLSVMMEAGMEMESVRANVKLAISGGQNEPRDAIAGTAWALLSNRDQLQLVLDGKADWSDAFEEYARWISI